MSHLEKLPGSVMSYLCQFIASTDLLQLRPTSTKILAFLAESEEANVIWHDALIRDFGFDSSDNYLQTLGIHPQYRGRYSSETRTSIFGYEFSEEGSVFIANSAFESWRHWMKASKIFLLDSDDNFNDRHVTNVIINAPYFLRAANIWRKIDKWCKSAESGQFGDMLLTTFLSGTSRANGRFPIQSKPIEAFEAMFAFCDGQASIMGLEFLAPRMVALFGGYSVYDHRLAMRLSSTNDAIYFKRNHGINNIISFHHRGKWIEVNKLGYLWVCDRNKRFHAFENDRADNGLLWMEEYVTRLEKGYYEFSTIIAADFSTLSAFPSMRSQLASRAVTNGIEIIASSIGAFEINAVVYSIRIRLLEEGEDGYKTPTERGYQTCQLRSRHWIIHDIERNATDRVSGDGVIGLYPLLFEGGYRNDKQNNYGQICQGEETRGIFQYQSCANIEHGTFQGKLEFIPGSLKEPTGCPFFADLAEIELKLRPGISYC